MKVSAVRAVGQWQRARGVALLLAAALLMSTMARADPVLPARNGVVVDAANILGMDASFIATQLISVKQRTGIALVVVTLPSLQGYAIKTWGTAIANAWSIGGPRGLGVVLVVAPSDRQARIEVGRGLRFALSDVAAFTIVDDVILPKFRERDPRRGVQDGVDALIAKVAPMPAPKSSPRVDFNSAPLAIVSLAVLLTAAIFLLLLRLGRRVSGETAPDMWSRPDDTTGVVRLRRPRVGSGRFAGGVRTIGGGLSGGHRTGGARPGGFSGRGASGRW